MQISNKKLSIPCTYHINNVSLDWVDKFKYLGVVIDKKLKWTDHINYSKSKATKLLNLLRRNLSNCSYAVKQRCYTALVRPHLEYAAPVWSPHYKAGCSTLENIQKRAARWISAKWDRKTFSWSKSYADCCKELNWLSLEQCRSMLSCSQVYKFMNNLDCLASSPHYALTNSRTRSHNLSLFCIQARTNTFSHSFFICKQHFFVEFPST